MQMSDDIACKMIKKYHNKTHTHKRKKTKLHVKRFWDDK